MLQGRLQLLDLLLKAMHLRLCRSQGLSTLCPIAKLPLQLFCLLSLVCRIRLHHQQLNNWQGFIENHPNRTTTLHFTHLVQYMRQGSSWLASAPTGEGRPTVLSNPEQSCLAHLCAGSAGAQLRQLLLQLLRVLAGLRRLLAPLVHLV